MTETLPRESVQLLSAWVAEARRRLAEPEKLSVRELNRLGELAMAATAWMHARAVEAHERREAEAKAKRLAQLRGVRP